MGLEQKTSFGRECFQRSPFMSKGFKTHADGFCLTALFLIVGRSIFRGSLRARKVSSRASRGLRSAQFHRCPLHAQNGPPRAPSTEFAVLSSDHYQRAIPDPPTKSTTVRQGPRRRIENIGRQKRWGLVVRTRKNPMAKIPNLEDRPARIRARENRPKKFFGDGRATVGTTTSPSALSASQANTNENSLARPIHPEAALCARAPRLLE